MENRLLADVVIFPNFLLILYRVASLCQDMLRPDFLLPLSARCGLFRWLYTSLISIAAAKVKWRRS